MKRRVWIGGVLACLFMGIVGCSQPDKDDAKKIGAILPLTGDAAVYGQSLKRGIDLALEQHNGSSSLKLEVIYEDDQYLPKESVSKAQKLIQVDKVPLIIGGAGSTTAEPITEIANRNKVVLLSPCATAPSLSNAGPYFFRLWPSDTYEGAVLAKTAWKKLGVKKVAILYVNAAYGEGIKKVFSDEFTKLGGQVVLSEGYAQGATDFRTQLSKIKASNVEWIFLPSYVKEAVNILKQSVELGLNVRYIGVNSLYDPKLLEVAGDAAEGAVFAIQTYDADSEDSVIKSFVDRYESKYGIKPDAFAATGYDAMRIAALAIENVDSVDGESLQRAMMQIQAYIGPSGKISFDEKGDVEKPLRLMTIKDGKFVNYE